MPKTQYDLASGKRIFPKHPEDVKAIICSGCAQVLLVSGQEKIRKAYQKAINAGSMDKAKALENFLEPLEELEEGVIDNGRETRKHKRNLIREGPLRVVRPACSKIRAQQAVV